MIWTLLLIAALTLIFTWALTRRPPKHAPGWWFDGIEIRESAMIPPGTLLIGPALEGAHVWVPIDEFDQPIAPLSPFDQMVTLREEHFALRMARPTEFVVMTGID